MQNLSDQFIRGYQLRRQIGEGGFGVVYRAYQPVVDREVAIKIILSKHSNQPSFIRNFSREAQLIARLEHPHIVPLYDFWRDPAGAYLVMRWLRGGNLSELVEQYGPMRLSAAAHILDQMAAALSAAHRSGVIHRDLKPANILLDDEGNGYLSDFGIALDMRRPQDGDLKFFGSPDYMAPEQFFQQMISPQGDIYSLGLVLFEILTGAYPFPTIDGQSSPQHMYSVLPSLQIARPDLPVELDAVLQRATSKQPDQRYERILDFALDFRQHADLAQSGTVPDGSALVVSGAVGRDLNATTRITAETHDLSASSPPNKDTLQLNTIDLNKTAGIQIRNPYKGLRAFEEADQSDFFGREALIEDLLAHLGGDTAPVRFVAVVGSSGSGKSSAVRAGLIPALHAGRLADSDRWLIAQMTPGSDPFTALSEALGRIAVEAVLPFSESSDSLLQAMEHSLPADGSTVFLFIDQLEELFAASIDEGVRARFIETLVTALNMPDSRLCVMVTLRADFYDRPLRYPALADLLRQHTVLVLPMRSDDLETAITAPADRAGLTVEPALVSAIIDDLREQPGALPLLEFALTELFERRQGKLLSLEAYRQIGGVAGALAQRADTFYTDLDPQEQAITQQMFLRLVAPGENAEDTRRRVLQAELESISDQPAVMRQIIEHLGQARLLTIDRDPVTRAPTVEVAHEALIREWARLRGWLDVSREWLRLQRQLALAVRDWEQSERDGSFLASGARLAQFEALLEAPISLSERESTYVHASIRQRKGVENRRRLVIATLIAFSVVAFTLAVIALDSEHRAAQEAANARSRELAVTALVDTGDQLDTALLLSREALDTADTLAARSSLLTALETEPQLFSFLHGAAEPLRALAVDPSSGLLAAAGRDKQIRFWDLTTRQPEGPVLSGHEDWINALAFQPGGHLLASASADHSIRLWDMATGLPADVPTMQHDDEVWALAFTPDGKTLISGAADGTIRLWDAASGTMITELDAHEDIVFDLAVMPDGRHFVSASADQTLRLWDMQSLESIPLEGHNNWVLAVAVDPAGDLIASGGADNQIMLWDAHSGEPLATLSGHTDWVRDLAFSADGRLASASADGTVRLWDTVTGRGNAALRRAQRRRLGRDLCAGQPAFDLRRSRQSCAHLGSNAGYEPAFCPTAGSGLQPGAQPGRADSGERQR